MGLARVRLPQKAADPGLPIAHYHEQILGHEPVLLKLVDQLNVS